MSPHPRVFAAQSKSSVKGLRRVLLGGTAAALLVLLVRTSCSVRAFGSGGGVGSSSAGDPYVTHELRLARRAGAAGVRCVQEERAVGPGSGVSVIGAAAPPPAYTASAVDLSLAHHLLPLTNLSALTTAALLDAAAANATGEGRALVRLHQDLYCSARLHTPDPPNSARSLFSNVTMMVYAKNDIVSDNLRGPQRNWESAEMTEFLFAMRAPVPASAAQLATPSAWKRSKAPFVVDIGANIGWFTINAAAAGGTVAAFEAMTNNIRLLRTSLCLNPWVMARVALYGTGLGTKRSTCFIISGTNNAGDGHTVCDKDPHETIKEWKVSTKYDYQIRGHIDIMRLDSLIDHDVHIIKIDVEGYETPILQGGQALFSKYNVWYVMAECNVDIIKREGQTKFLNCMRLTPPASWQASARFMDSLGYYISHYSFRGPFLPVAEVRAGRNITLSGVTLFCVKKELQDAFKSGGSAGARRAGALGI